MKRRPTQDFSTRNVGWMRRWRSQDHLSAKTGTYPSDENEWSTVLNSIRDQIEQDEFKFNRLKSRVLRKKATLTTKSLEETLVLRKINDNIRRAYSLSQPNRDELIRTAKQALQETTPKSIVRIDISKCYESINRKKLMQKLQQDSLVSHESLALLRQLLDASRKLSPTIDAAGLPRGVIVSTSLAEIRLREIDYEIRGLEGVYLLLRYVDDLLVFSTSPPEAIISGVQQLLTRHGLKYNPTKLEAVRVDCTCEVACEHQQSCPCKDQCKCFESKATARKSIEFLGYKFVFPSFNNSKKDKSNKVLCLLSDKKIAKVKTRMHYAFKAFAANPDADLLLRRISFLSSNCAVRRTPGQKPLLSGLSFTHSQYTPSDDKTVFAANQICELDRFLRVRLRKATALVPTLPTNLVWKISFESSFINIRRIKFTPSEIVEINRCWANA